MRRKAKSDFPAPGFPWIKTPRPSMSRQAAWSITVFGSSGLILGLPVSGKSGDADNEHSTAYRALAASIGLRTVTVLGPDTAAMGLHDLLGDAQAQTRILAEIAFRPVGVEAVENLVEILGPDARPIVLDAKLDIAARSAQAHMHLRAGLGERSGIVDEIAHHLPQAIVMTEHAEGRLLIYALGPGRHFEPDLGGTQAACLIGKRDDGFEQAAQVDCIVLGTRQFSIEARGIGNIGDKAVKALHVILDDCGQAFALLGCLGIGKGLDGASQRGERVLELMGDIRGESLDRVDAI